MPLFIEFNQNGRLYRVEFKQTSCNGSGSGWSAECVVDYVRFFNDTVDLSTLSSPNPPKVEQVEDLLATYPATLVVEEETITVTFTLKVLDKTITIVLTREEAGELAELKAECRRLQARVEQLEEGLKPESKYYMVNIKVIGDRIEFIPDMKENQVYLQEFMDEWQRVLDAGMLTDAGGHGLSYLPEWDKSSYRPIMFNKKLSNMLRLKHVVHPTPSTIYGWWHDWVNTSLRDVLCLFLQNSMDMQYKIIGCDIDCTFPHNTKTQGAYISNGHIVKRLLLRKKKRYHQVISNDDALEVPSFHRICWRFQQSDDKQMVVFESLV